MADNLRQIILIPYHFPNLTPKRAIINIGVTYPLAELEKKEKIVK